MHFFKWIGGAALIAIGLLAAYLLAAFEVRRTEQAEGFLALLRHIRMHIDCFSAPIAQILSNVDPHTRKLCAVPDGVADFAELLQHTGLLFPLEIRTVLYEFSANLGKSYKEEQLRCCDYCIARLVPLCEKLREELPHRMKLAWLLPPAMTGTLLLLLL